MDMTEIIKALIATGRTKMVVALGAKRYLETCQGRRCGNE